jgi:dTDP-glucose pyrophosphorylase
LQASSRNEYEITDIINASPTRKAIALEQHDLIWDGITYAEDVQRIQTLLA